MSLYRTYRPQTFADVAGQDPIVETLTQAVKQGKLSHAYLFAGTRGTGKTSIARILAKQMLLTGIDDETLTKQIVQAVEEGSLVDLIEIDAASNTGVDNIRDLIEKIQFSPIVAGAKVYIIDEVHMLSKGAFNALLKTLEEPPPYAYFILATTELHKIPATILSRCQRFLFRQLSDEDIVKRLQYIADCEKITIDRAALRAVAHSGAGSMRDAISLLDQLRSSPQITIEEVKQKIGETGQEFVEQLLTAIDASDSALISATVTSMEEQGIAFEHLLRLMLGAMRDHLHAALQEKRPTDIHLRRMDILLHALSDLRISPVPGVVVESALLSLLSDTPVTPLAKAAAPVAPIPKKSTPAPAAPQAIKPEEPVVEAATTLLVSPVTLAQLQESWTEIVNGVLPAYAKMSLKNGQLHALEENMVIVRFSSPFHRDKAASAEGGRALEQALRDRYKQPLKVRYALDTELNVSAPLAQEEDVNVAEAAAELF